MYITASAGRNNRAVEIDYDEPKKRKRKPSAKRKQYRYFQEEMERMKVEVANQDKINRLLMTLAQKHVQSGHARTLITESVSNLAIQDWCDELEE